MSNIQAVITQESAKVYCNFEQVKIAIESKLSQYDGIVFTEESKASAKKEVAGLRAEKKTFQDNLRTEKKKYMEPWERFEMQAKELIAMYDKPIMVINDQIQAFEEKRIAEKRMLISQWYQELIPDELRDFLPLKRIYNPKWENVTMTKKKVCDELYQLYESTKGAVDTIRGMGSEAVEKALEMYKRDLNLPNAITYINNYERQKQEILIREQERQRREEAERIRQEEREKIFAEQRAQAEKEAALRQAEEEKTAAVEQAKAEAAQEVIDSLTPDAEEKEVETYRYRIILSADAKEKLEMYMDSVGIEWELG